MKMLVNVAVAFFIAIKQICSITSDKCKLRREVTTPMSSIVETIMSTFHYILNNKLFFVVEHLVSYFTEGCKTA